jgi:hypothetical protein
MPAAQARVIALHMLGIGLTIRDVAELLRAHPRVLARC